MGAREGSWFPDAYDEQPALAQLPLQRRGVQPRATVTPAVVTAVREALDHLDIGNHHLDLGLAGRAGPAARRHHRRSALPGVVFGVSGGEAIDLALKVARGHTGRQGIVSAVGGYHGHTGLAMAAGDPQYRDPFGPNPPGFVQVPFGDLDALAAVVDDTTAAVILESIPATLGMPLPPPGYLRGGRRPVPRPRARCFVLDEVQTGLGRTGTMWSHTQDGAEPDIVVTGKGLSGGVVPDHRRP